MASRKESQGASKSLKEPRERRGLKARGGRGPRGTLDSGDAAWGLRARKFRRGLREQSKSAPHMAVGSHNTGLDIGSIGTHRETSDELSNSSGDDAIRVPGDRPPHESDRALQQTYLKPSKSAQYISKQLHSLVFCVHPVILGIY